MDALLHGCIPIVFLEPPAYRRLWPHHLFGWRHALLNVPPAMMLSEKFDLVTYLRTLSASRVTAMQRAVHEHGARVAYLEEAGYEGEDAADILLKGLAFGLPGRR